MEQGDSSGVLPYSGTLKRPATATGSRHEILGITRRVSPIDQMGATPAVPKDGNRIKDLVERAFILGVVKADSKFQLLKKHAKKEISMLPRNEYSDIRKNTQKEMSNKQDGCEMNLQWEF